LIFFFVNDLFSFVISEEKKKFQVDKGSTLTDPEESDEDDLKEEELRSADGIC
jgi:hypothetical protein